MIKGNKILIETLIISFAIILLIFSIKRERIMAAHETFNVGYKIHNFSYPLKNGTIKTLTTVIWYPTSDAPKEYDYNRKLVSGNVELDGKVDKTNAPYPFIVFSHGLWSCGIQSVYFTQYLASRGYIVIAPDHEDASICSIRDGTKDLLKIDRNENHFNNFPNRPSDIKAVIDEMMRLNKNKESIFYQTINENAIGVSGHSLGGWTSQIVIGAVSPPYEEYKDKRIKVGLLLAPNTDLIPTENFKKMNIPVMYILGEKDQYSIFKESNIPRRIGYDNANPPKFLPMVKGANHFTFADTPTCIKYKTVENCQISDDKVSVILKYSLAFLDRYLKNDIKSEEQLKTQDSLLKSYEFELK